jgi:hypothetical protein
LQKTFKTTLSTFKNNSQRLFLQMTAQPLHLQEEALSRLRLGLQPKLALHGLLLRLGLGLGLAMSTDMNNEQGFFFCRHSK